MSLWLDSLVFSLSGYDGGYDGPTEIAKPAVIFDHLAMPVPRSWWEPYLRRGKPRKDHVQVLLDLFNALKEFPKLQGRINYSLLVAMAFLDEEAKPSFGIQPNQQSIEEYIAAAEKVLAERPDVRRLGKVVTKMAIQIETEMAGKYCPKCKKTRRKALMVTGMIAEWSDDGFYLPDQSNKTDAMQTYEKCLACGTVLIEKPAGCTKKIPKKNKKTYQILAICGTPFDRVKGYMDDGSDSYKSFAVYKEGDSLEIWWEYPKERYGDYNRFEGVMGKFHPDTFFLSSPVTLNKLTFDALNKIYFDNHV